MVEVTPSSLDEGCVDESGGENTDEGNEGSPFELFGSVIELSAGCTEHEQRKAARTYLGQGQARICPGRMRFGARAGVLSVGSGVDGPGGPLGAFEVG